jgi:hypothetical protein
MIRRLIWLAIRPAVAVLALTELEHVSHRLMVARATYPRHARSLAAAAALALLPLVAYADDYLDRPADPVAEANAEMRGEDNAAIERGYRDTYEMQRAAAREQERSWEGREDSRDDRP